MNITLPDIICDNKTIEKAYNIAIGDLVGNIKNYKAGLLDEEKPCLMAGMDYNTPWTRDTAINVWNSIGVLCPQIAKNTLLSVCDRDNEGKAIIGIGFGQYWDCIIWTMGAYEYAIVNNDIAFLKFIYEITLNTLEKYEAYEFDDEKNLFYGPAVYGDGIASYPDKYADSEKIIQVLLIGLNFILSLKEIMAQGRQCTRCLLTVCIIWHIKFVQQSVKSLELKAKHLEKKLIN